MGGRDASPGDMFGFPFPSQAGCELAGPLLDALLDGRSLPPDAPGEAHAVARMLADLAGPAEPGELAGEAAARSVLARSRPPADVWPATRRPARRPSWPARRARPAAALIVAVVGLGGTAAAYAGALPGPIQNFAHHTIGAPPAHPAGPNAPHSGPASPGATRPGKPGSGTAWPGQRRPGRPKAHGTPGGATPAEAKGHGKPLPPQAHGKAKGHGKATGHGNPKGHGEPLPSQAHGLAKEHGTPGPPQAHGKPSGHVGPALAEPHWLRRDGLLSSNEARAAPPHAYRGGRREHL